MCNKVELHKDKWFFKGLQNGEILTFEKSERFAIRG